MAVCTVCKRPIVENAVPLPDGTLCHGTCQPLQRAARHRVVPPSADTDKMDQLLRELRSSRPR